MKHDYIIVGGGSAGSLAAAKLATKYAASVLLLEAGYNDTHPLFRMPAGFLKMLGGSRYLNIYESAPQPQLNGRVTQVPQANVLGGGSTINGMVYMRGKPEEYDEWDAACGGEGLWGWAQMLPHHASLEGNERLGGPAHGNNGPLKVSDHRYICDMAYMFLQTMQGMGVPLRQDFNAGRQYGVGFMQLTTDHARRCSAVDAFLRPAQWLPRLKVETRARVEKILFEGNRAVGVEYALGRSGRTRKAFAEEEVILTAGSYVTPKLLMLSGIGPEEELRAHGIAPRVALEGVGQNLQDHHEVPVSAYTDAAYGYHGEDKGLRMLINGLQYLLFRSGPVASGGIEACAFVNPKTRGEDTTVKIYCVPIIYLDRDITDIKADHGVTLNACLMRPKARGSVRLRSANAADNMIIHPNFLGHPDDLAAEVEGLRYMREIMASRPMRDAIRREILPGSEVKSDAELGEFCKRTVKTNYHPVGTCRMGREEDAMAVVTPELKVRGTEGLRVMDASAMPNLLSANTNAPTMALADKGVRLMMRDAPLKPIDWRE